MPAAFDMTIGRSAIVDGEIDGGELAASACQSSWLLFVY
jgi:hypothetical protein